MGGRRPRSSRAGAEIHAVLSGADDRQSLALTWLFNHTTGSVLLAMLAHASVNTALAFGLRHGLRR